MITTSLESEWMYLLKKIINHVGDFAFMPCGQTSIMLALLTSTIAILIDQVVRLL